MSGAMVNASDSVASRDGVVEELKEALERAHEESVSVSVRLKACILY